MSKVLLVDDETHILRDLGKHLRKWKYEVYMASTVEEARKIISCKSLDYAIIDLKLDFTSEFGGIKVVNYVKKNQPKIKPIVLSAYPFEDVKDQLKEELEKEHEPERILKELEKNYIWKGGKKNYILAILDKLDALGKNNKSKNCFVIMPFSSTESCTEEQWAEIFKNVIKPAVEEAGFNYECFKAEIEQSSILEKVFKNLKKSELVIADITDNNPNVLYELGIRHAIGGAAIVIAQNNNDIPFDLLHYPFKKYGWKTERERNKLKEEIIKAIDFIENNPEEAVSPVLKYLNPIGGES
ncbi:MAG: response regulator [Candidatus Aminicenantes bacterium]|nr:response regulator [Candidatus Aminicenantes bacterium]NIM84468.1 response regulator [Candidatus Aminicenantes bacterium]NIN23989.1 response regulator [Candidatus Aminicenantes bacterium]NIN47703.1 response regulator [Candidatus Aminicenantes bacterium]NIN90633.1 response regulator [Candidatus Aminicenantes bacterium]